MDAEHTDPLGSSVPDDGQEPNYSAAPNSQSDFPESQQSAVSVQAAEFAALEDAGRREDKLALDRFLDVNVVVSAELGRVSIPIGELLQLGHGSVLKLGRSVAEPVDLVAQGVRIGRGEVVVVNDSFAIRIKEIESSRK